MFCSIVLLATTSRTPVVIIYLQVKSPVLLFVQFLRESAPTIVWVSRSRGLPRSTLPISEKAPSLWHFYRYSCHILRLRHFPCRQPLETTALAYELARHEHYGHLSPCEHGLSSAAKLQRLPERY